MASQPDRGSGANTSTTPPGVEKARPDPGPAPVGPAVRTPAQKPVATPPDPGPAPVGPAADPRDRKP